MGVLEFALLDTEWAGSLLDGCFEILAEGLRLAFGDVEYRSFFPELFDRIPVPRLLVI